MKLKRLSIEIISFDVMKNSKPQPIGEKINRSKTQKTIWYNLLYQILNLVSLIFIKS